MAWDLDGQKPKSGSGQSADWVEEGNIEVFVFKQEPKRCRFLTEPVDLEKLMSEQQLSREQAQEYVNTELMWQQWIMPIGMWEHVIPQIPGQRYFSTIPASRDPENPITKANEQARQNGTTENKMLPFPLRKRFLVPAYFYGYDKVLFVKQSEEFFKDVAEYINRQGHMIDFDLYKEGKGFQTKYKAMFVGEAENKDPVSNFEMLAPNEINMEPAEEEIQRKLGNTSKSKSSVNQNKGTEEAKPQEAKAEPETSGEAGEFVMPFGSHKGKTLQQIWDEGNTEYLEFIRDNSAGAVQKSVAAYLGS